jgi:hypothetical protein
MNAKIFPEIMEISLFYYVKDPIPKDEFLELLRNKNFKEVLEEPKIIKVGELTLERATIAKKRDCKINYNDRDGIISIIGNKFTELLTTYNELEEILRNEGYFEGVINFEFSSRFRIQVGAKLDSMLKLIAQAFNENYLSKDKFSKFEDILGMKLQPFCIRFCLKELGDYIGDLREAKDWLDVYIFPYIPNTRYLAFWYVFRSTDSEKIKDFATNIEERTLRMLEVIISG